MLSVKDWLLMMIKCVMYLSLLQSFLGSFLLSYVIYFSNPFVCDLQDKSTISLVGMVKRLELGLYWTILIVSSSLNHWCYWTFAS